VVCTRPDNKMNIRQFQDQDKISLVSLWQKIFPDDPPHNEPSSVIAEKLAVDDQIFVAEENGEIIGACMAGYDGHRGWLYAVAVSPGHRRKNIGAQLVNFALQALKSRGCIKVNLQIRATNIEVTSFYKSLGFTTENRLSMGIFIK